MALLHGRVRLDAFEPEGLRDEQALMRRVAMHVDETCQAAFPGHLASSVEIELKDGRRLRHHQPTRNGDPDAPLTDAELADKFSESAASAIGSAGPSALLATSGGRNAWSRAACPPPPWFHLPRPRWAATWDGNATGLHEATADDLAAETDIEAATPGVPRYVPRLPGA